MGLKRKTKNIIEKFLSGEKGKKFFQVFYSLGAAVVIIGALAKINHWPFGLGSILLTIGLLTEFVVFLISAFDSPTKEYQWDRVFPVLDTNDSEDRPNFGSGGNGVVVGGVIASGGGSAESGPVISGRNTDGLPVESVAASGSGGAVIIGGAFGGGTVPQGDSSVPESALAAVERMSPGQVRQSFGIPNAVSISEEDTNALTESIKKMAAAADQLSKMAEMTEATQQYLDQLSVMSENMEKFSSVTNSLTDVSDILLNSYKNITDNSDGINQSSRGYVHQMESLNRNIQGLNTIYEIQLKSVSSQIDTIERINSGLMRIKDLYEGTIVDSSVFRSETEKMAQQLHALNGVYNRLLNAMTMNMYGAGGNPGFNPNPYNPGT
jgi:hypothetical protein